MEGRKAGEEAEASDDESFVKVIGVGEDCCERH